ncbi:NAD(P)/FAD-dependent oxidoreductase [Castellaniella sp. GW247-6E4]|uniref:NAD(P)/FAD-dependent oxidoreductase n=1 Tax=Castellaniella sp. GW247-6E4 TaxID=3140380 RepID=UPI003314F699
MESSVVVIGGSVAGIRVCQALRSEGFMGEITILSEELGLPYDLPPLSKTYLSGDQERTDFQLLSDADLVSLKLNLMRGVTAIAINPRERQVVCSEGRTIQYKTLVIACGARPIAAPWDKVEGVTQFRTIGEANLVRRRIEQKRAVVVIGGGFIGSEVASTARACGVPATIIERQPTLLYTAIGPKFCTYIQGLHVAAGVTVLCNTSVESVAKDAGRDGIIVSLSGGRKVSAGVVVSGIGVRPNTAWLETSGIPINQGILCDEFGGVLGFPDIYAIGDVSLWFHPSRMIHTSYGHWTRATETAGVVAHNIARPKEKIPYNAVPFFWTWQHGKFIQVVGRWSATDREIAIKGETHGKVKFAALYENQGKITCGAAVDWPDKVPWLRAAHAQNKSIDECVEYLRSNCDHAVVEDQSSQPAK